MVSKTVSISWAITLTSLTVVPFILRYFLKKKYHKLLQDLQNDHDGISYYECLFFDYRNFSCKPHLISREYCGEHCSYAKLERIVHYMASAKKSISICVYMMTLRQVSGELFKAGKRGVKVRIITDKLMGKTVPSAKFLDYLHRGGLKHKVSQSTDQMMHHKFCLIDEKDPERAKVFFGSVNLTAQALCKNFEAMILTNNPNIIQRFSEEFEELWKLL